MSKFEVEKHLIHEKGFLNQVDADTYYAHLDNGLPWGNNSWIPGEKPLKQLVYFYDLEERHVRPNALLEELLQLVERRLCVVPCFNPVIGAV